MEKLLPALLPWHCRRRQHHRGCACSFKALLLSAAAAAMIISNALLSRLPGEAPLATLSVATSAEDPDPGGNRFRRISQHLEESDARSVTVEAWSCGQFTALAIDGVLLVNQSTPGLHVFIVNQATASLMGHQTFSRADQMKSLVSDVSPGRILVLTSVPPVHSSEFTDDEATVLRMLGSGRTAESGAASAALSTPWALVALAKIGRVEEKLAPLGQQLRLRARIRLVSEDEPICPSWPHGEETTRRRQFCNQVDGFSNVCSCHRPTAISYSHAPTHWLQNGIVPLTVMSSNRPQFLFRTLTSLLSLQQLNLSQTHVVLRGFYEEPRLICDLLQLPYTQRKLVSQSLANLYRLGLADSFHLFPTAEFVILLEDDVDLSPDIIDFFNQSLGLMSRDTGLFCVGAWNDQSFTHTTSNPRQLQRTQHVPLKALAIRRSVWETELNEQWPEGPAELSAWLSRVMGPKRYCLRPALSRAFVYSQSLSLIGRLRPAYLTTAPATGLALDEDAHVNYDALLQRLIDSSAGLNRQFARGCQSAVQFATSLARNSTAKTPPALLISARVASQAAMQAFWSRVARCFALSSTLSCLYKGTCQVNFHSFILVVAFRPFCSFRLPEGSQPDLRPEQLQPPAGTKTLKYRPSRGKARKRLLL